MGHKNKSICVGKCLRRGVGGEDDDKRPVDVALVINMLGSHFVKWLTLVVTICFTGQYSIFFHHRKFLRLSLMIVSVLTSECHSKCCLCETFGECVR